MTKKRILLVDDEGYGKKCEKMRKLIQQFGVKYDVSLTLEDATERLFSVQGTQYDAVILDRSFPKEEGKEATGKEGELLLTMMEKRGKEIPVLVHSIMWNTMESKLVANWMNPWELEKLKHFLNYVAG